MLYSNSRVCLDGKIETIKAYREEASVLREFIRRTHTEFYNFEICLLKQGTNL
jgi:hypothetical protein